MIRSIWHIARTVLLEAVRRHEVYVIVAVASAMIVLVMAMDFFELQGLTKFYREMALKVMSAATAVTVIVLASRQLPREFETRTIYPLLARPISRLTFLVGKLTGIWLSAAFCFGLFMLVYLLGMLHLDGEIHWALFLQYLYLQMLMMLVLAAMGFLLSMLFNIDAAITVGVLLFALGSTLTSITVYLYDLTTVAGQWVLVIMTWVVPQLLLFDLSEKSIHAELWTPLGVGTMLTLTLYGWAYVLVFTGASALMFRRRAL